MLMDDWSVGGFFSKRLLASKMVCFVGRKKAEAVFLFLLFCLVWYLW